MTFDSLGNKHFYLRINWSTPTAYDCVKLVKSPKVRIAVLLIALVAPGFALAGEEDTGGG